MSKHKQFGLCKLTHSSGDFVASHIIPAALTRLSRIGEKFVEAGIGLNTKKVSNSWYDRALVTREGEDILSDIDAKGIDELRSHRLVWSAWGTEKRLPTDDMQHIDGKPSHRLIQFARPRELRLFFLSLLWRAAASSRPEFQPIVLSDAALEELRQRIVNRDPGTPSSYPIQLFQIISCGIEHNRTPLMEPKPVLTLEGVRVGQVDCIRFYFDGLVAHIHVSGEHEFPDHYHQTFLGCHESCHVFVHEYVDSRTSSDLGTMLNVARRESRGHGIPLNPIVREIRSIWQADDREPFDTSANLPIQIYY